MAFDPGPPPKRSEYLTEGTWWCAKEDWKRKKEAWRAEQRRLRQLGRIAANRAQRAWHSGGSVDGQPARTRKDGSRIEALWGGANPRGDGAGHGHIVSEDGINASYVREPGYDDIRVDDSWTNYGSDEYGEGRYH